MENPTPIPELENTLFFCLPWLFACFCVDLTKDLT